MCGFGGSGGRELMWFWHVGVDAESRNVGSDKVEGCLGFLWDVDAQFKRGLQEVLVDFVFGLVESEDHHAVGFIFILLLRWRISVLHVSDGPLLGGSHCEIVYRARPVPVSTRTKSRTKCMVW